ncbi:MAG TPA: helix-turn-helix transcriptional regulator [Flavobacterium sp.]|uniref:helix-turn-helix domain-containing protein n=1 Tax=Flavobacterium sp. TaxID=239 RepID=UPI002BA77675|nr:helix-turn-helix transcriptional regulator [Flavobacterium sp.]HNP32165.1 helix-turn-helix transcriptional regulator [Flavobacterium sp.]
MDKSLSYKVGQRIKEIRTEKNISQQDLASKCNFEKSNMSRIEAGRTDPKLTTLERICKGLDVDITELFKFS